MFDRFALRYPFPALGTNPVVWREPSLMGVDGYQELATRAAGSSVADGLLRIVDAESGPPLQARVQNAFPEFRGRAVVFAVDWLERAYAVNLGPSSALLLFEPGSGEAFEVDEEIPAFLDVDLVDDPDTFLALNLWHDWRSAGGRLPDHRECVGFRIPLFLGGSGAVANLGMTDLDVYWSLAGQLRAQVSGARPGGEGFRSRPR